MEQNMTEFQFGPYRLLVDVEATRAYYDAHPQPWVTCDCAGCRNFVKAVKLLPQAVKEFFSALGLDPEKPGEIMYFEEAGDGRVCATAGWYHLCGSIEAGGPWEEGRPPEAWVPVTDDVSVSFSRKCDLLPGDFPERPLQMDMDCHLPWVLEEPNPYIFE